ncbi:MAG: glucose 1-dehydrogenase [Alicyclobacillus sp.]|nr:glucose 1-dehydrogenase [Alicyclobacillus sp.]
MRLQGKVALITGAGRGIGAAIARGMAKEGANVVLVSRTGTELAKQVEWITAHTDAKALAIPADVGRIENVERMVDTAVAALDKIDILVNCAGISVAAPAESLQVEKWRECLNTNLDGTFFCCQKVGAHMIKRNDGGKIINITSIVAHAAIPERAAYAASKGGVRQLTQNLAVEWAKYRIQVNAITPGFIMTEVVKDYIERGIHKSEQLVARIPAGRMGEVDDLVGPAIFLASSESDYVTGVILPVDGGWLANGYV